MKKIGGDSNRSWRGSLGSISRPLEGGLGCFFVRDHQGVAVTLEISSNQGDIGKEIRKRKKT